MKIDFHSHYYPKRYLKELDRIRVREESKNLYFPPSHDLLSDTQRRVEHMRKLGIDKQVLSLANPWTDFFEQSIANKLVTVVNEEIAFLCDKDPEHFVGLGVLPLKSVEGAISEAKRVKDLGLKGVCVGTRIEALPLSDISLRPVLHELERLDLVVFMHPASPPIPDGMKDFGLVPSIGFPSETTLALTRLIFTGVLNEESRLKLVAPHLGGSLPFLIERINAASEGFTYLGFNPMRESGAKISKPPSVYLRKVYMDAISYSTPALECALKFIDVKMLVFGTDYPFTFGAPEKIIQSILDLNLPSDEKEGIFGLNAARLLRI